jgi:hypothetical protein
LVPGDKKGRPDKTPRPKAPTKDSPKKPSPGKDKHGAKGHPVAAVKAGHRAANRFAPLAAPEDNEVGDGEAVVRCNDNNHQHNRFGQCLLAQTRGCDRTNADGQVCGYILADGEHWKEHHASTKCWPRVHRNATKPSAKHDPAVSLKTHAAAVLANPPPAPLPIAAKVTVQSDAQIAQAGQPAPAQPPAPHAPKPTGFEGVNQIQWPWTKVVQRTWGQFGSLVGAAGVGLAAIASSVVSGRAIRRGFTWLIDRLDPFFPSSGLVAGTLAICRDNLAAGAWGYGLISGTVILGTVAYFGYLTRPYEPSIFPPQWVGLHPAPINGFLWDIQNNKITLQNEDAMLKYVSNVYNMHCVQGLEKYFNKPTDHIANYAMAKDDIVRAAARNMAWYSDTYDRVAKTLVRLNYLGGASWRPP